MGAGAEHRIEGRNRVNRYWENDGAPSTASLKDRRPVIEACVNLDPVSRSTMALSAPTPLASSMAAVEPDAYSHRAVQDRGQCVGRVIAVARHGTAARDQVAVNCERSPRAGAAVTCVSIRSMPTSVGWQRGTVRSLCCPWGTRTGARVRWAAVCRCCWAVGGALGSGWCAWIGLWSTSGRTPMSRKEIVRCCSRN